MYSLIKRAIDFVAALLLLLATSPLFLLIAVAIKLDSRGPVFYTQKRLGRAGRLFTIYKFRSMKTGTPELATDRLSNPNDHITSFGRFLRSTSLDECPQLLNILLGDMSFVGPRPSLFNQYELNRERIRLGITDIRPGLTGYAQIKGRDFISDEQKLKLDHYYLNHLSFSLDLAIICSTVLKVIKREGVRG